MRLQTLWIAGLLPLNGFISALSEVEISATTISEERQLPNLMLDEIDANTTDPANICQLVLFVPFSYNRTSGNYFTHDVGIDNLNNLGFSHLAAAALAVRHFNSRDASVVPQLGDPKYQLSNEGDGNSSGCPIQLSIGEAYDTGTITHRGTESLMKDSTAGGLPCALVGTYNDLPAQTLGATAAGAKIPLTIQRAYNMRSADGFYTPYTTTLYPDQGALATVLLSFLRNHNRDNYIAILHKLGDTPVQLQQVLSLSFDIAGWEHRSYNYNIPGDPASALQDDYGRLPTANQTLERIRREGFRTIVCIAEFPERELPILAEAADRAGINTGDYFWIFIGVDLSLFSLAPIEVDLSILRLVAGAAIVTPLERFDTHLDDDPFMESWKSVNSQEFIDDLNSLPSAFLGQNYLTFPGYYQAAPDYFQRIRPASGAGFMYDSIIATGLGACHAYEEALSSAVNSTTDPSNTSVKSPSLWQGPLHLNGIRQTGFEGATGGVSFQHDKVPTPGLRKVTMTTFGVLNLFDTFVAAPEGEWDNIFETAGGVDDLFSISHILEITEDLQDSIDSWVEVRPFVFRNGQTTPPELLRDEPEQNHLLQASRIMGLLLMSIVMVGCIASAIWLYVNRVERIVKAAQPPFMYRICVGGFIQALGILPLSFDEGSGATKSQMDIACVAIPWTVCVGHMLIYGCLFSKLWRVDRVLQFRRTTVSIVRVAWPAMTMSLLAACFLGLMTAFDPLRWERTVIDEVTGESVGKCDCEHFALFAGILAVLMITPTAAAGVMSYKTIDIDSEFAESYWIFILIVLQVEVTLLGMPMIAILRDLDTQGRYWGILMVMWTFPASTISLLMIPKIAAHRRLKAHGPATRVARGAGKGQIHVSGISTTGALAESTAMSQHDSSNKGRRHIGEEEASRRLSELSNVGLGGRSEVSQDTDI